MERMCSIFMWNEHYTIFFTSFPNAFIFLVCAAAATVAYLLAFWYCWTVRCEFSWNFDVSFNRLLSMERSSLFAAFRVLLTHPVRNSWLLRIAVGHHIQHQYYIDNKRDNPFTTVQLCLIYNNEPYPWNSASFQSLSMEAPGYISHVYTVCVYQ